MGLGEKRRTTKDVKLRQVDFQLKFLHPKVLYVIMRQLVMDKFKGWGLKTRKYED